MAQQIVRVKLKNSITNVAKKEITIRSPIITWKEKLLDSINKKIKSKFKPNAGWLLSINNQLIQSNDSISFENVLKEMLEDQPIIIDVVKVWLFILIYLFYT